MSHPSELPEQRQAEIDERLDPRWHPLRAEPVLSPATIHYELPARQHGIAYGGLGIIQQLVKHVGLAQAIDDRLILLKRHLPYHESDHVLSLVYSVLCGGRCLEDLELRRQDVGFLEAIGARRIPDPTTSGDFLRRFGVEDVETLMDVANEVRSKIWAQQPLAKRQLALIDVDGTVVETTGHSHQGADFHHTGRWGYGPLVVSLANSREVLYAVNRPANRPSHDGAVKWLDQAIAWARASQFERVRLRGDTDFSLTAYFDRWSEEAVEFVFGMDAHPTFVKRAQSLQEDAWRPLDRPAKWTVKTSPRRRPENVKARRVKQRGYKNLQLVCEHLAEVDYTPVRVKSKRSYRLIILRKNISVEKGEQRLFDEIRYFFYVTNVPASELSTEEVVRQSNARCDQENLIEQLKNGVKATKMPVAELVANWAYMVIATLAWNLKAWLGLVLPEPSGAAALIRMEFRRFFLEILQIPTQILRHARRLVYRPLAFNRWTRMMLEANVWFKRTRCI